MDASTGAVVGRTTKADRHPGGLAIGGRRTWIMVAAILLVGGAALNWNWLVAVGVAPLLLALAPCAAMCALGLCSMRGGDGCKRQDTSAVPAQLPDSGNLDGLGRAEAQ